MKTDPREFMTFQNDLIGSSPARHASMRPSVLLFGATSILGFNLAQLFPKPFYRLSHPGIAAELSDNGRCSSWRIPIGLKRSSLGTNPKFSFTATRFATYRSARRLLPGLARSTSSMFVGYCVCFRRRPNWFTFRRITCSGVTAFTMRNRHPARSVFTAELA